MTCLRERRRGKSAPEQEEEPGNIRNTGGVLTVHEDLGTGGRQK